MDILNTLLFWAAVVLCTIAIYEATLCHVGAANMARAGLPARSFSLTPKQERIAIIVIALIAIAIRVYQFGGVPSGFNQDGAMAAVDGKALADYGTDRFGVRYPAHLTAWGYAQMSSLLSYLIAPLVKLFGLNPITARLPLLVVSLAGLWCLYLFARDVFGRGVGLIIFAFGAINPWHIMQSRWTLDCNLFPHFFLFGLFFLNLCLKHPRRKLFLCLSMVMFGLSMYGYGVSIYTVPLFLFFACVYLLSGKKVTWADAGLALAVYLLVAFPFIMTMAINTFHWDSIETPFITMPAFPDSVRSNDVLFFTDHKFQQLKANLTAMLNVTLLQTKDLPWSDMEGFGTMYLFSMPFAFAGLVSLIKDHRKTPGAILALFFLLTGVWCGAITGSVNINRLNIIYYPIIILTALGICFVVRHVPLPRLGYGMAAAYLLAFGLFSHAYFTDFAATADIFFFKDFTQAVASLKDCGADKFYITTEYYRGAASSGEILTMFYHQIDAEYFQGKTTPPGELPYREKYTYSSISDVAIDPTENAAYVITQNDLVYFPAEGYTFTRFGELYTVTRAE